MISDPFPAVHEIESGIERVAIPYLVEDLDCNLMADLAMAGDVQAFITRIAGRTMRVAEFDVAGLGPGEERMVLLPDGEPIVLRRKAD